ncbi:MAG TPA: ATP phosphoribosyltransferase regulatory subunit [Acidimicrobiales bacterium]
MPSDVQPPRGMRDFLPADKALRDAVMGVIRDTFASYGYREIETPVAEDLGRLESGQGGDNEKLIYKILRRGLDADVPLRLAQATDLGLRFDLTLPLSRFYATHRAELPSVFRSTQIAPVWRAERPQKGRYRQFVQCDIDVLGEASEMAEIELIAATMASLERLGIDSTSVRINDRRLLSGLLDACGVDAADQPRVLITIDKLDKIGVGGVADELRASVPAGPAQQLIAVIEAVAGTVGDGDFDATLAVLPRGIDGPVAALVAIRDALAVVAPGVNLVADPTLVRGQGYYTGTIFELANPASAGSVGGGGRYDNMIGRFAGVDVPACGSSLGFERIVELVDPERFASRGRAVAVLYDTDVDPAVVVGWQRRLIADGLSARLVRRGRNQGRILKELAADGLESYLSVSATTPAPTPGGATPELRALRAETP